MFTEYSRKIYAMMSNVSTHSGPRVLIMQAVASLLV